MQTYKYYLPTGERLGIFYEQGIVTVIPCSKKDQFDKNTSKIAFALINEEINTTLRHWKFEIVFTNQEQFLQWCNNHYKKLYTIYTPVKGKILKIEKQKRKKLQYYEIVKTSYLA